MLSMSNIKKIHVPLSILKLQKCAAYQNGVEFCHKPNGTNVRWSPPFFFFFHCPWETIIDYKKTSQRQLTTINGKAKPLLIIVLLSVNCVMYQDYQESNTELGTDTSSSDNSRREKRRYWQFPSHCKKYIWKVSDIS